MEQRGSARQAGPLFGTTRTGKKQTMAQMSPFQLFGMKPAFMIDEAKLEAAYQTAMMKVHPDRFADRPAAERRVAEQWSTRINEAYQLLKNPMRRAAWLCENAGHPIEAETNTRMPADFLMTQIMWREALESGDTGAAEAVRTEAEEVRTNVLHGLAQAVDSEGNWSVAVDLTRRLMFIDRFLEEASCGSK
jgi:molecular chaperone HscB